MARRAWGVRFSIFFSAGILLLVILIAPLNAQIGGGGVNVLTWHNDVGRTGQNLSEGTLLYNNLSTFGQRCSAQLDGQVYAQPLVVTNVPWPTTSVLHNVAYVVTENDTLYAINATPPVGSTTCTILASVSLLSLLPPPAQIPVPYSKIGGGGGKTINPKIGILSTPAINISGNSATIYLVTHTYSHDGSGDHYYHYLHALDISNSTIVEKANSPVRICGNGCGSPNEPGDQFSHLHIQRAGLLYLTTVQQPNLPNDMVYVGFSLMDGTPGTAPNGFIFGYNATNLQQTTPPPLQFQTSQGQNLSYGGGIWMGAAGLAWGLDQGGGGTYIYVTTGDGTWDGISNWGNSFLKLDPATLTVPAGGYFTPSDYAWRDCNDFDNGSGGVMLLPNDETFPVLYAIHGEKESGLWFLNRANPGQCTPSQGGSCSTGYQCLNNPPQDCTSAPTNPMVKWTSGTACYHADDNWTIHNTPTFWEDPNDTNYIYIAPSVSSTSAHPLFQYRLCAGNNPPVCGTAIQTPDTFPFGSTPSVSASVSETATDGIIWAIAIGDTLSPSNPESTVPGTLYAYQASSVSTRLYRSSACPNRDRIAAPTKFSVPTVANGYVYVGAEQCTWNGSTCTNDGTGTFYIFGLNAPGTCN